MKWKPLHKAKMVPMTEKQIKAHLRTAEKNGLDVTREQIEEMATGLDLWKNDQYQVDRRVLKPQSEGEPDMIHLSIKRIDRKPVRDWRDLQNIKNQLVGEDREAVELFPAEDRLVDSANQYHLWCIDDPNFRWPFGFDTRFVTDETDPESGAVQRSFDPS